MRRESMESFGQLIRHGQVRSVIRTNGATGKLTVNHHYQKRSGFT
jgi:hypothetical protein